MPRSTAIGPCASSRSPTPTSPTGGRTRSRTSSAILAWIAADPPDLVVHTGDITADDPDDAAEADFARQLLQSAALPMVAIPGNHDVGGFSGDRFDARRLDGVPRDGGGPTPGPGTSEGGGWSGPTSTGSEKTLMTAGCATHCATDRRRPRSSCTSRSASFDPDRPTRGDWSLPMAGGAPACARSFAAGPVRVVASGHLHRLPRGALPGGVPTVWAPAASFLGTERHDGSTYRVGVVEHLLAPDGTATHRMVEPPGVTTFRLEDLAPPGSESLRDARSAPPLAWVGCAL